MEIVGKGRGDRDDKRAYEKIYKYIFIYRERGGKREKSETLP